ncbi:dienelactone hydrolase [Salibacterium salarium]|uniref:Dienelactone hydrolase n=1 Tax=Salibacterium salarium TaxID=284579 RepID=A0A3R9QQF2_9BACI|nr:alpha/beta hydrolase family protein [Salibacterium salarium]RSL35288.1 dienelactone hydrolase [Salibacterium salarium]
MSSIDDFFQKLYESAVSSHLKDKIEIRSKLKTMLGCFDDQTLVEKAPTLMETKEFSTYHRERWLFHFTADLSAPVYVLTPKNDRNDHPAVLALHGHGYGSREIVGLTDTGEEDNTAMGIHQHFAVQLVKRGMKVFAPEVIGFGDRRLTEDIENENASSCYRMAFHLLMAGKTLAGLRVFEARRVLDTIETFSDVCKTRLGVMGFSGGGLIAAHTAALDERIRATVLCGFTNTYKHSILTRNHCIDNYVPGAIEVAELPDYIGLIAPRPLFIESGSRDPIFPVKGTESALRRLTEIYENEHAGNQLDSHIFDGVHEISGKHSYDWMSKKLQK